MDKTNCYEMHFFDQNGNDLHASVKQPVVPDVGDLVFVCGWQEVIQKRFNYSRGLYVEILIRKV